MKLLCKTSDLLQGLQLVGRAISTQQALPILGNILIDAKANTCTLSATDLELSIVTSFSADIEIEGTITIPAKAALHFAQYNTDEEVMLETQEGTQLKCTSKHAKTLIAGESAQDYPTITSVEKETEFSLEAAPLLHALHVVTFASARTSIRPVLSGVYIRTEKGKLILVATDSYRLSEFTLDTTMGEKDISCIVPTKVLEELKSVISSGKEAEKKAKKAAEGEDIQAPLTVDVVLSSQQLELRVGSTRLISRLIEGKFPPYQQIVPKEVRTTVGLSTREIVATVKRMHYFAKEMNNNLTFSFANGEAHIATPQTQLGKDEATLGAEVSGEENKIALSSAYLLDFLGHAEGDALTLEMIDSKHPAVFHIPSQPQFMHLIMPLRLQEDAQPAA